MSFVNVNVAIFGERYDFRVAPLMAGDAVDMLDVAVLDEDGNPGVTLQFEGYSEAEAFARRMLKAVQERQR